MSFRQRYRIDSRYPTRAPANATGLALTIATLLTIFLVAEVRADDTEPVILAVHPYLPPAEIQARYSSLAMYLQKALERKVVVRVGKDYGEHITFIGNDKVDIAYLGPAAYVQVVGKYGSKPLLARLEIDGRPVFHGYLVTNANSGVTDIASLRGKRFAFGAPESTMSHLVPRYMLLNAGIHLDNLADYQFLGSHKNVALGVLAGDFDAGAVKEEVVDAFKGQGLRPFAKSSPFSEHLFVARSNAAPAFIDTVRKALLSLSDAVDGHKVLQGIKSSVTAMVPVKDSDYDNLRRVLHALRDDGVE